ncbi:MAG: efflux RND transporter periplasmic adaptor subunit [Pseudomonadota bacterium]
MNNSVLVALVIAAVTGIWLFTGTLGNDDQQIIAETQQSQENALSENALSGNDDLTEVRVRKLEAEWMVDDITVTGRTRASRQVNLKAEISGQVAEIIAEKGTRVQKGDVLVKLSVKDRGARVREAEQLVEQRRIQFNAAKELQEKGFNSRVRLAEARAQLEAARAGLERARIELADTKIKAPFDAVINDQFIEIGDFVDPGTNLLRLVDLDPLEITGFVTEQQVTRVGLGTKTEISFIQQEKLEGEISFVAAAADPETRTFEIEISVPNDEYKIKEGLTAEITIPLEKQRTYKISPSVLALTDEGVVGVKTVDDNDKVQFTPIKLIKDTPDFLWVSGLPDTMRLITVGQEFVTVGQTVKPVAAANQEGLL